MYIKSIVIEGFKSYGQRVVITDFDRNFNAITGLNGSGKSNILDAICFVLGLTNLSQVRAGSLQELVFKKGTSGVTTATVTITFDNSDPSKSPIGFEDQREFTVARQIVCSQTCKNRYLVNGVNTQSKRVHDIFNSVQLNINNPHFLIMQGRITKVLNMKPLEILSMVEEAAGTSMYESKRIAAERTICKKELKLDEINRILNEDITPRIERVKTNHAQYVELQKIESQYQHKYKIFIAFQYTQLQRKKEKCETDLKDLDENMNKLDTSVLEMQEQIKKCDEEIRVIQNKTDKKSGGKITELENELRAAETEQEIADAACRSAQSKLNAQEKAIKSMQENVDDDVAACTSKEKEIEHMSGAMEKMNLEENKIANSLENARNRYNAVNSGLFANEDGTGNATLQDQLIRAKNIVSQAQTNKKNYTMEVNYCETGLEDKRKQMKDSEHCFRSDQKQLQQHETRIAQIKKELSSLNYEGGELEELQAQRGQLSAELDKLHDMIQNIEIRNPRLTFQYKDPEANFNRKSVKGLVCKLFRVPDSRFALALENACGGKLFSVIVANEHVSKKLIRNGQLAVRTTFVPMNQIRGSKLSNHVIRIAKEVTGGDKVFPAISLITYEAQYQTVMEWLLGDVFICVDNLSARTVTFHNSIKKKSVTLDGDVYDPSGVVHGGSKTKQLPVLSLVDELEQNKNELREKENSLENIERQIGSITKRAEKHANLTHQLELAESELSALKKRLANTAHYQLQEEIKTIEENIASLNLKIKECIENEKDGMKKVTELEKKVKNVDSLRKTELKSAEEDIKKYESELEKIRKNRNEQNFDFIKLEIEDLKKAIVEGKDNIRKAEEHLEDLQKESEDLKSGLKTKQKLTKDADQKLQVMIKYINEQNREIQNIVKRRQKLVADIESIELKVARDKSQNEKLNLEIEGIKNQLIDYVKKNEWINAESPTFGQSQGMYNFQGYEFKKQGAELEDLKEKRDKMKRGINMQAAKKNLAKEMEDFDDLIRKRDTVEADKMKIKFVISELEEKKKVAVNNAWEKINKDFGTIFGQLLPGSNAELRKLANKEITDGLEIKVCLGNTWKESLSELSGGQRSLVALSFILAMLLFKPAPIYILDEVDAALDLSHTQNIGQMLRSHFTHSQFIVVSLKEGMFSNANVIYRTEQNEGISSVTRTVGHKNK